LHVCAHPTIGTEELHHALDLSPLRQRLDVSLQDTDPEDEPGMCRSAQVRQQVNPAMWAVDQLEIEPHMRVIRHADVYGSVVHDHTRLTDAQVLIIAKRLVHAQERAVGRLSGVAECRAEARVQPVGSHNAGEEREPAVALS
jgi:hypothetical protein